MGIVSGSSSAPGSRSKAEHPRSGRAQTRETPGLEQQAARAAYVPTAIPVSPQRRRQSARKRLNQRAGAVANRVLDELHLPRQGRQLVKLVKGPMAPNSQVVIRLLNKAISAEVNDDRGEASADDLERAYKKLDAIADEVRDDIAKKL